MFEREYRDLAFVPRWSIIRQIKGQSVAEHSFYVALYAGQVATMIGWKGDMGELLTYALNHDMEECFAGDMPGPIKRIAHDAVEYDVVMSEQLQKRFPYEFPLIWNNEIKAIVKIADGLDEIFYLGSEWQLGNRAIEQMYDAVIRRYHKITLELLINVFHIKPDDAAIMWRLHVAPAITHNQSKSSEVLNDLAIK